MKVIVLFSLLLTLVYVAVRHQQQVLAGPAQPVHMDVATCPNPATINYPLVCSFR